VNTPNRRLRLDARAIERFVLEQLGAVHPIAAGALRAELAAGRRLRVVVDSYDSREARVRIKTVDPRGDGMNVLIFDSWDDDVRPRDVPGQGRLTNPSAYFP
jgi:hypothetical protein